MTNTTANRSASITVVMGTSTAAMAPSFDKPIEGQQSPSGVPNSFRTAYGPTVWEPAATWLGAVQRRLNASIGVEDAAAAGRPGSSLTREVVVRANTFFDATSDLFPSEPYLYGTKSGDLVAEFANAVGRLTVIVTKNNALAYAVKGNKTFRKELPLTPFAPESIRGELSEVTKQLRTDQHGAVDAHR